MKNLLTNFVIKISTLVSIFLFHPRLFNVNYVTKNPPRPTTPRQKVAAVAGASDRRGGKGECLEAKTRRHYTTFFSARRKKLGARPGARCACNKFFITMIFKKKENLTENSQVFNKRLFTNS